MRKYELTYTNGYKTEVDATNPQEAIQFLCNKNNLTIKMLKNTDRNQANIRVKLLNGKRANTEYYFIETKKANIITLYHGSPYEILRPEFGRGEDKHDYGKGLYLTPNIELAKEWSVCTGNNSIGYVYKISLNLDKLKVLDFDELPVLNWIAELMSHRDADNSARYRRLAPIFIEKYKVNTSEFDIIKGWRADASYFSIVKRFVRDEIDLNLIPKLFKLGDLGIQYCIKSKKAFEFLNTEYIPICKVDAKEFIDKYSEKDTVARDSINKIIESRDNTMQDVFSKYI